MGESGGDFREISDCDGAFDAQAVRFKENLFSLQPSEEITIRAAEFDVAQAAVAENMAADTDLRLVLSFEMYGCHFKILFECCFSCR